MSDTDFSRRGVRWRRAWVGDNGGRYEWLSERARVWRVGPSYFAEVDGQQSRRTFLTLLDAMDAATSRMQEVRRAA